ncbi:MAG: hypothetical protein M3Q34_03155 [bacterium]|nr:hypothetical protein [bacterium]
MKDEKKVEVSVIIAPTPFGVFVSVEVHHDGTLTDSEAKKIADEVGQEVAKDLGLENKP